MNSKAYHVYNIKTQTQTIIEFVNVVVDDANDFSEFSEEELISSLIDEKVVDQTDEIVDKSSASPNYSIATVEPVTTKTNQTDSLKKLKNVSKDVLTDPTRKEPSSRVKKNHLS